MGRYDDYLRYHNQYQRQYGPKTVVLYQCGMFHEIYGVSNATEQSGADVKELAGILNIQPTRQNKKILENSQKNTMLCGFQSCSIDRYVEVLLNSNYTVVIVDQIIQTEDDDENIIRKVSKICSPSTNVRYVRNMDSDNYLVSLYFTCINKIYTVGMSSVDVSTGKCFIHEITNSVFDYSFAYDECVRFIETFQPTEIIINGSSNFTDEDDLKEALGLEPASTSSSACDTSVHIIPKVEEKYTKINFQNHYFGELYPFHGELEPLEFLGLEKYPVASACFLSMLKFCEEHDQTIVKQLSMPTLWTNSTQLILDTNAINQLNLVDGYQTSNVHHSKRSVLRIFTSSATTTMGKRLLKERLLLPIIDPDELDRRYDYVEKCISETMIQPPKKPMMQREIPVKGYWYEQLELMLKDINDIERFHRRMSLGTLNPIEFAELNRSYHVILELLKLIKDECLIDLFHKDIIVSLQKYIDYYSHVLHLDECDKYNIDDITDSIFNQGQNLEIDRLSESIRSYRHLLTQLQFSLSTTIKPDAGHSVGSGVTGITDIVKLKQGDSGYYYDMTKPRYNILVRNFRPIHIEHDGNEIKLNTLSELDINDKNKTNVKISGGIIDDYSRDINNSVKQIRERVVECYTEFLKKTYVLFEPLLRNIVKGLAELDVYKATAKVAVTRKYCRPNFASAESGSCLEATNLRHPIIENLNIKHPYVPYDIQLGKDNTQNGILLYGINSSGKSSTMKSVGIAIIMAQAGFYVAADNFYYYPYRKLMTRILGDDNIYKGLSSYIVEMNELRGILNRADQYSLVLGDEVCRGTETNSGISLVAASIMHLSKIGSSFIFATHLHQLAEMDEINSIPTLRQYHFKVYYDREKDKLVYDRKLSSGSGSSEYGIEVASAMKIPRGVIISAYDIRNKYFKSSKATSATSHESRYNPDFIVDRCCIGNCDQPAVDTHHIQQQSEADNQGFINGVHKNVRSNLVGLCKKHHDEIHVDGTLAILGYDSDGKVQYVYRNKLLNTLKNGSTPTPISTSTTTTTSTSTSTSTTSTPTSFTPASTSTSARKTKIQVKANKIST